MHMLVISKTHHILTFVPIPLPHPRQYKKESYDVILDRWVPIRASFKLSFFSCLNNE